MFAARDDRQVAHRGRDIMFYGAAYDYSLRHGSGQQKSKYAQQQQQLAHLFRQTHTGGPHFVILLLRQVLIGSRLDINVVPRTKNKVYSEYLAGRQIRNWRA